MGSWVTWVVWVHGFVGRLEQIVACVVLVTYIHKILAWFNRFLARVQHLKWVGVGLEIGAGLKILCAVRIKVFMLLKKSVPQKGHRNENFIT